MNHRQKLWASAGILLLLALSAEGLVRVRGRWKYGATLDIYDVFEPHPEVDILRGIPGSSTLIARTCEVTFDSRGFRSPEVEVPKPKGVIRFAFLGASTTLSVSAATTEDTWPSRLLHRLALDPLAEAVEFDHVNAAFPGACVEDSRISLHHRLREVMPDVIVIYHATSDLVKDTRPLARQQGLEEDREIDSLERVSLLWRLVKKNYRHHTRQKLGHEEVGKLDVNLSELASDFGRRMGVLIRDAQEVAELIVLVTYSIKPRIEQSIGSQRENFTNSFMHMPYLTRENLFEAYAAYNQAARTAARQAGALVVGGELEIPGTDEYFADSVHFTTAGYEMMADRVAAPLIADPRFAELLRRIQAGD